MRTSRRQRGKVIPVPMIVAAALLLCISSLAYIIFRPRVVSSITIEAGSSMVDVREFLRDKNAVGSYVTDVEQLDLHRPGTYEIEILIGENYTRNWRTG